MFTKITVIVALVLLIVLGYFTFNREQKVDMVEQKYPHTQKETVSWETHTDESGYTIKYPPEWAYKKVSRDIVCLGANIEIVEHNIEGGGPTRCEGDRIIIRTEFGGEINLDETIVLRREINPNVNIKKLTIDGVRAVTIYENQNAETFFSKDDTGYTISLSVSNDNYDLFHTQYESILSTFRFE